MRDTESERERAEKKIHIHMHNIQSVGFYIWILIVDAYLHELCYVQL